MAYKVLLIDLSDEKAINSDSIVWDMLSKTGTYEVEVKHRLSMADASDYSFIIFLNPRIDTKSIIIIEKIAYNLMVLNPRLSYNPSELSLVALSGALSFTGRTPTTKADALYPHPPTNLLNSAMTAMAVSSTISMHVLSGSNCGQYGVHPVINDWIYMTYFITNYPNMLDGTAPYYTIYRARDWRYVAVACIESKFFKTFVDKLPISDSNKEYLIANQMQISQWPDLKEGLQKVILTQTAQYWHDLYKNTDAWVCKIFTVQEAAKL